MSSFRRAHPPRPGLYIAFSADAEIRKSEFFHLLGLVLVPAVKDHGMFHHSLHLVEIGFPEMVPFGQEEKGVRAHKRIVVIVDIFYILVADYFPRVFRCNRVIRLKRSATLSQSADDVDRRGFTHIIRQRLENLAPYP